MSRIKISFVNKNDYPIKAYFKNSSGKIFRNKIKAEENCDVELHVDEMQKASLFLRFVFGFVARASYSDKNDSDLPLLLNRDIIVAKYDVSEMKNKGKATFEISDSVLISSEGVKFKEVMSKKNPRVNKNVETSHFKQYLIGILLLLAFIGIVALSILIPIWLN